MRSQDESRVLDVPALRMREATIIAAIPLTFGVAGLGSLYVALTWDRPHRLGLAALFVLSVAGTIPVYRMREAIVRSHLRELFFLSWTLSDFALLVLGTIADGGTDSPLVLVFFIPVVFSAMSYPLGSVVAVGTVSVLSYLAVALTAGGSSVAYEIGFAFVLLCTAAMSGWQADRHKRQHRALATASRTDQLTGCLNRRGFEERANAEISSMRRRGRTGALIVLDIDKFKPVNDVFGHAAGDALLCWVVETLETSLRPGDSVGRLGGDEFAALLPETDAEQARTTADRVGQALARRAPASLGLAIYPEDGEDLETLTRRADTRLYQSRRGRDSAREGEHHGHEGREPLPSHEHSSAASGLGAIGLWRAALDAIPARGARREAGPDHPSLESVLLEQIDASVIATDMAGVVISWNRGAQALYGWTNEEAVGRSARELVVPQDAAAAEALMAGVSRDGRWDGELLVRRKDGSLFTVYVRNRLVLDEDGSPSAVVGVAVDISARVAAETELLQSRDYAQAVTECMGEGLFTLDADGRVTYINKAAAGMLGRPGEQLHGELLNEAIYPRRSDGAMRSLGECPIARALSREVTVRVDEDKFRTHRGELPVSYTATPFHTDGGLRGCVVIFQDASQRKEREEEHRRDAETLACIDRVEQALAEDRFVLHAQPIVDLRSGEIGQHELLLRMHDSNGGLVAPGEFLPVAEKYGLIGDIDRWVIKQAARLAGEGSAVQANISARSVGDSDVLDHIERCIEQSEVAPGKLIFEMTETAIAEDQCAASRFAERLQALGCGIALDDFGTGYNSLTYLKQIPVDYLKLDIEFVRDLTRNEASRHVVQAVVALARDFHLRTVGEGVEDAETLELLRELGVDFAQGYHLARPEPFDRRPGDRGKPGQKRSEPRRSQRRRGAPAGAGGAGGALRVG